MKQKKQITVVHSTKQRIIGALALLVLFVCGLMVGLGINDQKVVQQKHVVQQVSAEVESVPEMVRTCAIIEDLLVEKLPPEDASSEHRIERAKVYANLSERGCVENSQRYVDLAKQELEIARALEDDVFEPHETIEVVETYKRLHMQAAAEEIFEMAKKLTEPAIDFILEVEKIINEQ